MGTHTYRQTVKLEVARDLLHGLIADITARLEALAQEGAPDAALVEQLESEMTAIGVEADHLDVRDEARLDAIIAKHRKEAVTH